MHRSKALCLSLSLSLVVAPHLIDSRRRRRSPRTHHECFRSSAEYIAETGRVIMFHNDFNIDQEGQNGLNKILQIATAFPNMTIVWCHTGIAPEASPGILGECLSHHIQISHISPHTNHSFRYVHMISHVNMISISYTRREREIRRRRWCHTHVERERFGGGDGDFYLAVVERPPPPHPDVPHTWHVSRLEYHIIM